jgi:uncharacterized protein YecT (DUF1311 family)
MRLPALLLAGFLALAPAARADEAWICDTAKDNAEHIVCADREFQAHDAELNRVYQTLLKAAAGDTQPQYGYGPPPYMALKQAQRAWVAFRDSNCHWKATQFYGGTEQAVIMASCRAIATRDRVAELKAFQQN